MLSGFWLMDERFKRLEPLLPTDGRGVARVDDRRVISGIVQVLKSGYRWKDFQRIATRYDKRADTFLTAFQIAALIAYWL